MVQLTFTTPPTVLLTFYIFLLLSFIIFPVISHTPLNKPVWELVRITFHLPLFSHKSFHYIPWTHNNDNTLRLHYSSLNLTPPLQFDNQTMTSLDHTFRILDGQLTTRLATLKDEISHLHEVQSTTLNDWLTYFTFGIACIHSFVFIILYCRSIKPKPFPPLSTTVLFRRKRAPAQSKDTTTANADNHELHDLQPATSQNQNSVCPSCNKPFPL